MDNNLAITNERAKDIEIFEEVTIKVLEEYRHYYDDMYDDIIDSLINMSKEKIKNLYAYSLQTVRNIISNRVEEEFEMTLLELENDIGKKRVMELRKLIYQLILKRGN